MYSKIITNRISPHLLEVISYNQAAFVSDWRIADNVFLAQEMMDYMIEPVVRYYKLKLMYDSHRTIFIVI